MPLLFHSNCSRDFIAETDSSEESVGRLVSMLEPRVEGTARWGSLYLDGLSRELEEESIILLLTEEREEDSSRWEILDKRVLVLVERTGFLFIY